MVTHLENGKLVVRISKESYAFVGTEVLVADTHQQLLMQGYGNHVM